MNAPVDWYERRHELEPGQVFLDYQGNQVMLDRTVPGDGSAWYVAEWTGTGWSYMDSKYEPSDLRERLED